MIRLSNDIGDTGKIEQLSYIRMLLGVSRKMEIQPKIFTEGMKIISSLYPQAIRAKPVQVL
ncbi:hypothetical protein Ciccas_008972 [Cichlidogyrus casuarinus]|uniref:Uncharacterized protein n=1 Tax=Cichlidogyrus casuarinus TaxID=1844966 RepID=A0ABD2PYD8_9PLAT